MLEATLGDSGVEGATGSGRGLGTEPKIQKPFWEPEASRSQVWTYSPGDTRPKPGGNQNAKRSVQPSAS